MESSSKCSFVSWVYKLFLVNSFWILIYSACNVLILRPLSIPLPKLIPIAFFAFKGLNVLLFILFILICVIQYQRIDALLSPLFWATFTVLIHSGFVSYIIQKPLIKVLNIDSLVFYTVWFGIAYNLATSTDPFNPQGDILSIFPCKRFGKGRGNCNYCQLGKQYICPEYFECFLDSKKPPKSALPCINPCINCEIGKKQSCKKYRYEPVCMKTGKLMRWSRHSKYDCVDCQVGKENDCYEYIHCPYQKDSTDCIDCDYGRSCPYFKESEEARRKREKWQEDMRCSEEELEKIREKFWGPEFPFGEPGE